MAKNAYIEKNERYLCIRLATRSELKIEPMEFDEENDGRPSMMYIYGEAMWRHEDPDLDALVRHIDGAHPEGRGAPTLWQVLKMAMEIGRSLDATAAYQNGYANGHRDGSTEGFEKGKQYADQKPNGAAIALEDEMLRVLLKHAHLRRDDYETSLPNRLIELTCYDDYDPQSPLSVGEILSIAHDTGMEDAQAGAAPDE